MTAQDNRDPAGSGDSMTGRCGIGVVRNGINFSKTPFAVHKAAPDKGAETDEILKEYGYNNLEIEKLNFYGITATHKIVT